MRLKVSRFIGRKLAMIRCLRILVPCMWRGIVIWNYREKDIKDWIPFFQAHYPKEWEQARIILAQFSKTTDPVLRSAFGLSNPPAAEVSQP